MTLKRMDNVGVVVDDLAAAVAFFKELGLELEGEAEVEGRSVDRLIGLDGVLFDIAMMRTPDGPRATHAFKARSRMWDIAWAVPRLPGSSRRRVSRRCRRARRRGRRFSARTGA